MPSYPINVPIPKGLAKEYSIQVVLELRKKLEDYLNERAKDSPVTVLTYPQIANATGIYKEIIKRFLKPLTGSYSGITINNPDLKDDSSP